MKTRVSYYREALSVVLNLGMSEIAIEVDEDNHFIVDIFRVAGGKVHDYLWHSPGGNQGDDFTITTEEPVTFNKQDKGTLLGENIPFGYEKGHHYSYQRDIEQPNRQSGYSWLKGVQRAKTASGWTAIWLIDKKKEIGLKLHMTGDSDREVFTCKGEGFGLVGESPWDPYIISRHECSGQPCKTVFTSVIEPYQKNPFINKVRKIKLESPSTDSPELKPVMIIIETINKDIFYVIHDPNAKNLRDINIDNHNFQIQGQFGVVHYKNDFFKEATLVNGKYMTIDNKVKINSDGVIGGIINSINLEKNILYVKTSKKISTYDEGIITVNDKEYSHGESFPIEKIEKISGYEYRIYLKNTSLIMGTGIINDVNDEENTMKTMTPQTKLFNGRHLYNGKSVRINRENNDDSGWYKILTVDDKFSMGSEKTGGVKFYFSTPKSTEEMKMDQQFWVHTIAPGDSVEILSAKYISNLVKN